MNAEIVHRGPDDSGIGLFAQAGIGMRRLSIIDLSGGHQPIYNEDRSLSIVFNGEIYNYRELRHELQSLGHRFATASDTEVILHGYEQWGEGCLNRLNGMFAFALWNEATEELFLARDPVGQKPLYLYEDDCRLLFASEIKSLLAVGNVRREVDPVALHYYLTYLYVPPPRTMLQGVTNLPPGHWARWRQGTLEIQEYWAGPEAAFGPEPKENVRPEEVLAQLTAAVQRHLISDVPVGCLLSGGIDSSAIAAIMARELGTGLKTFTAGFPGAGIYDERGHAATVARHIGSEHHEVAIGPDSVTALEQIVWHLDEPLGDASVIPNYFVAHLTGTHVKAALSGIGGDETFGGYQRYFGHHTAKLWRRCPRVARQGALALASRFVQVEGSTVAGNRLRLAQKLFDHLDEAPERRYVAWNTFLTEEMKASLYADGKGMGASDAILAGTRWFDRVREGDLTRRAMYVDLKSYLPGDPLLIADKMSMAHSLELRIPFLDRELMDFAFRVPASQHRSRGTPTKRLLREAVAGLLPSEILVRPKQGFGTPIDLWLRGALRPLMQDALSDRALRERGWFNPAAVRMLMEVHQSGKRDYSQHLWVFLIFELWHRQFIDGPALPAVSGRPPVRISSEPAGGVSPLRILIAADVDPGDIGSGAERVLATEIKELTRRGHSVTVLCRASGREQPLATEIPDFKLVRFRVLGGNGPASLASTLKAAKQAADVWLSANPCDVVFVQQPMTGAGVLMSQATRGIPVFYNYHSPWSEEYRIRALQSRSPLADPKAVNSSRAEAMQIAVRQRLERHVLSRAYRVRCLSHYMADLCADLHGLTSDRCIVIPGGVDTGHFRMSADPGAVRARLSLETDEIFLLTIRGLETRMGLGNLLAAMPAILREQPNAVLIIGGEGPLKDVLCHRAAQLNLGDRVRFTGFIPEAELPGYYGAADLFVLPTIALEGFGLVTVEALSCGTPVMGTPVGGTPEILRGLDPTLILESAEPDAIARGILANLDRVSGREEERTRCRDYAIANYSWSAAMDKLESALLQTATLGRQRC